MKILVSGGAGYVGSHIVVALAEAGHEIAVLDNFCTSHHSVIAVLTENFCTSLTHFETDITDAPALTDALTRFTPDAVIHCAGLKSIAQSWDDPLEYYRVNTGGTLNLLHAMEACGCGTIVFSSSATVYGDPHYLPIDEQHPIAPINPYGRSKFFAEQAIADWQSAHPETRALILRYYNPVGAHKSLLIGEAPTQPPNNLFPVLCDVLTGRRSALQIFGDDYETHDGTGERDYINICDLALAHIRALATIASKGTHIMNLGTGKPHSVREIIGLFERHANHKIPTEIGARRKGDAPSVYADNKLSQNLLGDYTATPLDESVRTGYQFARKKCSTGN